MRLFLTLAYGLLIATTALGDDWGDKLARAEKGYDIESAKALVSELRAANETGPAMPQALLLLAELHRFEFEALDESNRAQRRALGETIDALADEALGQVESLPESSHQQRLTADLLAVKIRSKYKAKRFRKPMERAAARAVELDPTNADALVSVAKPYLFADEDHRGDVERATGLLNDALEIDPHLEKAQLLLALADEQRGDRGGAIAKYEAALDANPNCRPAQEALLRLRESGADQ